MPTALHSANRFARLNPMVVVVRGSSGGLGMTMSSKSAAAGTGVPQSAALLPTLTPAGRSSNEGLESFSSSDRSRNCAGAK